MDILKSPDKKNINEVSNTTIKKTIERKNIKLNKMANAFNSVRPADPLINRKNITLNPVKYPSVNKSMLKLPNFHDNIISYEQKFDYIPDKNILPYNYKENMKDIYINSYINMSNVASRLIYARTPLNKEGNYTIDNIINLNQIYSDKKRIFNNNISKINSSFENIINFESNFECGNLQFVYLINSQEDITEEKKSSNNFSENNNNNTYQLFLQNDTNTRGYSQWFFFKISNGKKGQKIKLNIMNFQRKKTRYSNGLKIWYFSTQKKYEKKIGWHHTTEPVEYFQNFLFNYAKGKRYYYYTLSFEYSFEYDNDEIYFANSLPFLYTDVLKDLNVFTKQENEKYFFFEKKKLCSTILGNDVDYFIINNDSNNIIEDKKGKKNKKGIVLFARQHPGETVSSWVLKGAYEYLMSFSEEAKYLRDNYIIKIIPMVNIDGVICGNSRTSLAGCDLNRRWENPDILLHPEIYHLKDLIINFNKNINIEYIIDFHGHFGTFNSLFFCNNKKDDAKFCKYFPFACCKISDIIRFDKCSFKMPKYKYGTGRIRLFNELNIENIVTLETSYFGCNEGKYINQYFNIELLKEIGRDICKGILLSNYNKNINQRTKEINIGQDSSLNKDLINEVDIINNEFNKYININKTNKKEENKEENLENVNNGEEISESESEPSRDNLDEIQIKKLFSIFRKKKIIKRKRLDNFLRNNYYFKKSKISTLKSKIFRDSEMKTSPHNKINNISLNNTIKNNKKNITINNTSNSIKINKNNNFYETPSRLLYKNKKFKYGNILNKFNIYLKNYDEKHTQTEEIFFTLHWTNFIGEYKILTAQIDFDKIKLGFPLLVKFNRDAFFRNLKSKATMVSTFQRLKINQQNNSGRNAKNIKYIFNSNFEKAERINSLNALVIKNDYKKIIINEENDKRKKSKRNVHIKLKKNNDNFFQSIVSSFVSSFTGMKKNDYLQRYLSNENRYFGI